MCNGKNKRKSKNSRIGRNNLNTSNKVPTKKNNAEKQIAELKKKIENQNKKINNLDSKVADSNDKYFASIKTETLSY